MTSWRLVRDGEHPPAANLARDEALFLAGSGPTLRFYLWNPPGLSLGYFQPRDWPLPPGITVVRRPTGGGAILHQSEVTYCAVAPLETRTKRGALGRLSIPASYEILHLGVLWALESLGIRAHPARTSDLDSSENGAFLCFQRRSPTDLIVEGRKIAGSAQRRTRERLLQHGSVLLRAQPDGPRSVGVQDLVSSAVGADELCQALVRGFGEALDAELVPGSLDEEETLLAERLVRDRYQDPHWRRPSESA